MVKLDEFDHVLDTIFCAFWMEFVHSVLEFWEETAVDKAVREWCCKQLEGQQMKIVAKPNCGDKNMTVGHKLERAQTSPI